MFIGGELICTLKSTVNENLPDLWILTWVSGKWEATKASTNKATSSNPITPGCKSGIEDRVKRFSLP